MAHCANPAASVAGLTSGSGRPLPSPVKDFFEPRFGHDFSQVRIHTDDLAAESARAVNALAYTVGQNIVFASGQYMPGTGAGDRLLAHELTHIMQQRPDNFPGLQRKEDHDRDEPANQPATPSQAEPADQPAAPSQAEPVDKPPGAAPKAVTGSCGGNSVVGSVTESDKRMNGSAVTASLGATEFGNTSKLGADFKFSACKVGTTWRFQLDALVIPIVSKVQDVGFKKNVDSATNAEVTKTAYPTIVSDLSPTGAGTFSVSCGGNQAQDRVTTYSSRTAYWNQQFVIDHEAFHRKDWVDMYKKELTKAESDITGHSIPEADAPNAAAAVAKANPELTKFMTDAYQRLCAAFIGGKESRAYDAGAPAYQKLVDEIKARATKEGW